MHYGRFLSISVLPFQTFPQNLTVVSVCKHSVYVHTQHADDCLFCALNFVLVLKMESCSQGISHQVQLLCHNLE